ncbi:LPXTG cell wall anchor domain-containing protein [Streptomyces sp. NPDC086080]|uniref:LPXTG cell wall anchor domain-containing protein n=1 Tax=Streptomyces sp. NPDC086080 TaxID=3365748 RepID=UPI0037D7BBFA
MTKKTRIRVARIAAGAVIAAGASLTAAGAASAFEIGVSSEANDAGLGVGVGLDGENPGEGEPGCEVGTGPECPEEPGGEEPGGEEPGGEEPGGEEPGGEEPGGEEPGGEEPGGEEPGGEEPGGEEPGGEDPVEEPSEDPTTPGNGNGNGNGGNAADPDGGTSPQQEGSSSLTDTGDDVPATSAQGNGKELAETGAAEMTFLVIGAATMIAGGIGFRVLPRLMTGRGGAAA